MTEEHDWGGRESTPLISSEFCVMNVTLSGWKLGKASTELQVPESPPRRPTTQSVEGLWSPSCKWKVSRHSHPLSSLKNISLRRKIKPRPGELCFSQISPILRKHLHQGGPDPGIICRSISISAHHPPNSDLESDGPDSKSWLCHLPRLWTSHCPEPLSACLTSFTCETGTVPPAFTPARAIVKNS